MKLSKPAFHKFLLGSVCLSPLVYTSAALFTAHTIAYTGGESSDRIFRGLRHVFRDGWGCH